MDEAVAAVNAVLDELSLRFTSEQVEDGLRHYRIHVDESDDAYFDALLYAVEEESYLRLMYYIDDLSEDDPSTQMRELLALNGELPSGCFCMDPEQNVIYATANLSLVSLNAESLAETMETLLYCAEAFDVVFYPTEADGISMN